MSRPEDEDIQAMLISMCGMRLEGVPLPDVGHGQALEITSSEGNPQAEPVYQGIRYLGVRQRFFSGRDFPDGSLELSMSRPISVTTLATGKIGAGSTRKIQEP